MYSQAQQKSRAYPRCQQYLIVVTLNYGGILNNPFEFYSDQTRTDLQGISKIFIELLPLYIPNFNPKGFGWNMGKIDKNIRIGRYSPYFKENAGIQNGVFLNRTQFEAKWQETLKVLAQQHKISYSEQEKNTTKLYDFIIYHALLKFVFKDGNFQELIKNNPRIYTNRFESFYRLSYLDEDKKLKKFNKEISAFNADILCLQQYSSGLQQLLSNNRQYYTTVDETKDCLIAIKRSSFNIIKRKQDVLNSYQLNALNFDKRTPIIVADQFIILNVHLSSKEAQNKIQMTQMKQQLVEIRKALPNYHFIVLGDLNSFLEYEQPIKSSFQMYPIDIKRFTTAKMRTMTQGQFKKGNKLVVQSKDKILTTLKLMGGNCVKLNGQQINQNSLLPSDSHPFDHFLVFAYLHRP